MNIIVRWVIIPVFAGLLLIVGGVGLKCQYGRPDYTKRPERGTIEERRSAYTVWVYVTGGSKYIYKANHFEVFNHSYYLILTDGRSVYVPQNHTWIWVNK